MSLAHPQVSNADITGTIRQGSYDFRRCRTSKARVTGSYTDRFPSKCMATFSTVFEFFFPSPLDLHPQPKFLLTVKNVKKHLNKQINHIILRRCMLHVPRSIFISNQIIIKRNKIHAKVYALLTPLFL